MSYQESLPQAELLQSHYTSFVGGSNILEATLNDASYRCLATELDNALRTPTQLNNMNSHQTIHPNFHTTFQDSPMINNEQSPQPSPEPPFPPGLGRTDSSSDWSLQQTSAANNDSLIFSSPIPRYNPGQNHHPHSTVQTQVVVYDTHQLPYEHGDHEGQHGFQSPDERHVPSYPEDPSLAQLFRTGFPSIAGTLPYNHLGQLPVSSLGQSGLETCPGHSSNGSTPTATCSGVKEVVPDILNSPNDAHDILYSVGSSGFHLSNDVQQSSNFESSSGYHSPETDASSLTLSSFEPTDNLHLISSASRNRHSATSHHDPFENTPLHRPLSARTSDRRSSIGKAPIQPKPQRNVAEGTQKNVFVGREINMPRKGRGRRTKPLEDAKRKAATKRRNERTVCIGCKMAKVICEGREHGGDCGRCTNSQNNAPKPFVCVPASFIELVYQGSTMLLALHTIYSTSSDGFRQEISLPSRINVRQLLKSIGALKGSYGTIRAYEGHDVLFELDLEACWTFINANYPPTSHDFHQFIDGLKIQRQGNWRSCFRNGTDPLANLCKTLFTWENAASYATYAIVHKINHEVEHCLDPNNEQHMETIIAAAQLYRIIGRQLELQFYNYLKKALSSPSICRKVVLEVGHAIVSLRRRLASWTYCRDNVLCPPMPEIEPYTDGDDGNDYRSRDGSIVAERVKNLCLILYVYFCYMRRRLPAEEQKGLHIMKLWDPHNQQMVEEHFPQYESKSGFEDWLQFIDETTVEFGSKI